MKIGLVADGLAMLSRSACLDRLAEMKMACVEFGTGCWSSAPHLHLDALLASAAERERLLGETRDRDLEISALNCSGNPLHPGEADCLISGSRAKLLSSQHYSGSSES
jgi:sugar phosphate isomerase/epimerase